MWVVSDYRNIASSGGEKMVKIAHRLAEWGLLRAIHADHGVARCAQERCDFGWGHCGYGIPSLILVFLWHTCETTCELLCNLS